MLCSDGALAQAARRLWGLLLGISQSCLDVALGTLLWVSLLRQALEQRDPEGPVSLSCAVVLRSVDSSGHGLPCSA